jgi:putative hydrolase of the HAD superfamily
MTIEMVFFDAGGTLLDPHPSFAELFAATCRAQGYEVTDGQVNQVQDRLAPHLTELVDEADLPHAPSLSPEASHTFWTFTYKRFLGELGIEDDALVARLYETFSSTASYRLYDDVKPALDALETRGHRIGLISNFDSWLEKMLVEMEVGHVFDPSIISGMVGVEKPDPEIYRIAVARAGVDASRAVHVGDSPRTDMEPAKAVGITPILLDRAERYPDSEYHRITTLEGLPDLVEALEN